jgi:CDP-diglyceride synthetase
MGRYVMLLVFFCIGFVGVYFVNKKETDPIKERGQWVKYFSYLLLVFAQLFLIDFGFYFYFAIVVIIIGVYELISIGTSKPKIVSSILSFMVFGVFFVLFFRNYHLKWQQFVFVIVIAFDGYSQIVGQLVGKTKLFPKTSPNKTVEGSFGGLLSVLVSALLLSKIVEIPWKQAIGYAIVICLFALFGDFLASYYKRQNAVKDYSRFIPGHGGVLDRFDSLIMAGFGFFLCHTCNEMNSNVSIILVYACIFLFLFFVAELLYHSFQCKVEVSRKWVHISSGLCCLSFPFFIHNHWIVLLLCASFTLLLFVSTRFQKLPSIHKIDRKSHGSLLFPVAVYCSFLSFQYFKSQYLFFYLPMLVLGVCDPLAALIGKKWPFGKYKVGNDYKTVVGSTSFFASCFIILVGSLPVFMPFTAMSTILLYGFFISLSTTIVEALSKNGIDNATIPCCVTLGLIFIVR